MTTAENEAADADLSRRGRLRLYTILGLAVISGLTLLSTTQTWWTITAEGRSVVVQGSAAAPALAALALTGLALAAALAIAGPVFRFILGLLQLLLAFTIVFTTSVAVADPVRQSESLISKATGVAGLAPLRKLVSAIAVEPWTVLAIAAGSLAFLAGIWLLLTFRAWPVASRKYSAVKLEPVAANGIRGQHDAVVDWDSLTKGGDPTDPQL